jgi:hypothetical protein
MNVVLTMAESLSDKPAPQEYGEEGSSRGAVRVREMPPSRLAHTAFISLQAALRFSNS